MSHFSRRQFLRAADSFCDCQCPQMGFGGFFMHSRTGLAPYSGSPT